MYPQRLSGKAKEVGPGWVGALHLAVRGIIQRVPQELGKVYPPIFVPNGIEEVAVIMMGLLASNTGSWMEGAALINRALDRLFGLPGPPFR